MKHMLLPGILLFLVGLSAILFHRTMGDIQYNLNKPYNKHLPKLEIIQTAYLIGGIVFLILGSLILFVFLVDR
jgi:hypothetical protein